MKPVVELEDDAREAIIVARLEYKPVKNKSQQQTESAKREGERPGLSSPPWRAGTFPAHFISQLLREHEAHWLINMQVKKGSRAQAKRRPISHTPTTTPSPHSPQRLAPSLHRL